MSSLSAQSLPGLPEISAGDDLAGLIVQALHADHPLATPLHDGRIVVIAHKAVSKAEGAVVDLATVTPGERARALAAEQGKDARAVQVVLDQSAEILRAANGVLIGRTHHGFVCANAGVDASNVAAGDGAGETLIVLPRDPDASARALRARLRELTGAAPAVLITDSFGRAWRHGQCDVALGCAGMAPLEDWRGRTDSVGLELRATWIAVADAAAACADLARAKDSREPVVLIDGLERFVTAADGPGAMALLRALDEDLFR
ncbi:MAG TPA: coenzyme F420-0:L-glutamate ligase [Solirubrobacteraceae bacterium]|jgi:coenzyme F420-0:L-glutamate ligase/coenzyme F420-1:gamma-L-glutamate ligase